MPSRVHTVLSEEQFKKAIDENALGIEAIMETLQLRKSGYKIKRIDKNHIHYDKYHPTRGGKYMELPTLVALKRRVSISKMMINSVSSIVLKPKPHDIYAKDYPDTMYHYHMLKESDNPITWEGMHFPTSNDDIDNFEEINHNSISGNVHRINPDESKIIAPRTTRIQKRPLIFTSFLLNRLKMTVNHYALIKDYCRLMSSQTNEDKRTDFQCMLLHSHLLQGYMKNEIQNAEMPDPNKRCSLNTMIGNSEVSL